jgi:YesN/AraC family two-component response regulator
MLTIVDDRRTALALGAAEHLLKPIDRDVLTRVLDRFCPRDRAARTPTGDDNQSVAANA